MPPQHTWLQPSIKYCLETHTDAVVSNHNSVRIFVFRPTHHPNPQLLPHHARRAEAIVSICTVASPGSNSRLNRMRLVPGCPASSVIDVTRPCSSRAAEPAESTDPITVPHNARTELDSCGACSYNVLIVVHLSADLIFDIVDQNHPMASTQECRNLSCCRRPPPQPLVNFPYMGSFLRFKKIGRIH